MLKHLRKSKRASSLKLISLNDTIRNENKAMLDRILKISKRKSEHGLTNNRHFPIYTK